MKRTNYAEAVGLLLIGFTIYHSIYGTLEPTGFSDPWGVTNYFGQARAKFSVYLCAIVVVSLHIMQGIRLKKRPEQKSTKEELKAAWSWPGWSEFFKTIAVSLAISLPMLASSACIFALGYRAGFSLGAGFIFLWISIYADRQQQSGG